MSYQTVIEKRLKPPKQCRECRLEMGGTENFCPECGTKTPKRLEWDEKNRVIPKEELQQLFKETK